MQGSKLISSHIQTWAALKKDGPCLIEATSDQPGRVLRYQDLPAAVGSVRTYLGSKPKTVLVALPGGIIDATLWLAGLTSGHLLIPVSPDLTAHEYEQTIQKHKPNLIVITDSAAFEGDVKIMAKTVTESDIRGVIDGSRHTAQPAVSQQKPKDGSVFLSTSGSTGKPKGMILSASKLTMTAQHIIESHGLKDTDRGLTPLPFHHVNAPVVSLLTTILSGGSLVIVPRYSTTKFWQWVEQYDPTWISLVPAIIAMLLETDRPSFLDKSSLRFIRTASAQLPLANLLLFEKKFKLPLVETYGISEAASTITANPVPPGVHKPGSVGLPVGVMLRICQPDSDHMMPPGQTGEVCIQGNNVITTYQNGAGQDSFSNGWFRTGDLGYIDEDGYVFLAGRIKDIIVRGGENIMPREIEELLCTHPDVAEAVVVGHPDPILGEKVVAFIIAHPHNGQNNQALAEYIQTYSRQKLSRPKVPETIYIVDELPKTHNGKVDKPALRRYAGHGQPL